MLVVFYLCCLFGISSCNNFPSLLSVNATLAIIIDREYMADRYSSVKTSIEDYLTYAKRELLKHGGVNVQYYSWTTVNIKDFTAVLSIAPCSDTWEIFEFASQENALHIAISDTDCPRLPSDKAMMVSLITRGQEVPQIILDLRVTEAYKWKSVVMIYDHTLDRDIVERVTKSVTPQSPSTFNENGAAVSLIQLESNVTLSNMRPYLNKLLSSLSSKESGANFLAILRRRSVEVMMESAKRLKLSNPKNQWLYLISDTNSRTGNVSSVKRLLEEGDNISFIYNITDESPNCKEGLLCHLEELITAFTKALDLAVVQEYEIASQVSDEEWEAIRPSMSERSEFLLLNIKHYLKHNGVCGNCTLWKLEAAEAWGIEYGSVSSKMDYKLIDVGYWSPGTGPVLHDVLFPHVEHGFRRKNLPVVSFHNPPWQILTVNETGAVTAYEGLVFDVLGEIANNLNFTFTVQVPHEFIMENISKHVTNKKQLSNVLTNIFPESIRVLIQTKVVAMAACGFTISERNRRFVNFTAPINIQSYGFLVARPKELSRALLFMSPFTRETWLCLGLATVTIGPILFLINHFSPVYEYKGIEKKGGLASVQNCMWYVYGALLQQAGMHLPNADSARIVVGTWWIVVLIMATTYCGSLVAFLTFPKMDVPLRSIDDVIAREGTLTWSIPKGCYMDEQLKTSFEQSYKILSSSMQYSKYDNKMVEEIANGKHVYFDWLTRLHFHIQSYFEKTGRCDITLGTEMYFEEQIGIAVPTDTPYLNIFNYQIKRLHQTGLIEKWFKSYLPKKNKCFRTKRFTEVTNHRVNLDDMQGSFFVLFIGFMVAALWLTIEKLWYRRKQRMQLAVQPFVS